MLSFAFWSINIGLALMVLISLLPIGLMQRWPAWNTAWYARSAEFLQTPIMDKRWLRAPGDTVFGIGIVALGWFVLGLKTGWSRRGEMSLPADVGPEVAGAELEPVGSAG